MTESKRALSEYVYQSKYSLFREDLGRKETWDESVERIRQMHLTHLERIAPQALQDEWFMTQFNEAIDYYKLKKFVGSQCNLQFGGEPVLKSSAKSYNCSYSHCDRLEVFRETEWLLLSGCGCGLSVEQAHVLRDMLLDLGTSIDVVLEIQVDEDEVVERMLKRAQEQHRTDDTEPVMRHRLEVYHQQTLPVATYYVDQDLLEVVDGTGSIDEVTARIFAILDSVASK